jgi:transcriptional regulator with XRE-family HTH domain
MTSTPTSILTIGGDHLGPLLHRARRLRGTSQRHLADQLCAVSGMPTVSRHEVSRWEREERLPSPFWLGWLSDVLGIPLADLERASNRTRDRRTADAPVGIGLPTNPQVSPWPWRLIRARPVTDSTGHVTLRVVSETAPRHFDGAAAGG